MKYVAFVMVAVMGTAAWGQLSKDEVQRRMDEMNKRAATRPVAPTTRPTTRPAVQRKEAPKKMVKAWRAKPGAPLEVLQYLADVPRLKQKESEALQKEMDRLKHDYELVQNQRIDPITVRDGGIIEKRPNTSAIRQRRERLKAIEADTKKLHAQAKRISEPDYLPTPIYNFQVGGIGMMPGPVKILQVIDDKTFIAAYERHWMWMEGVDTKAMVDDRGYYTRAIFICRENKQYETALGGSRTVLKLEPFALTDHLEEVEVEEVR
jgi:hypothetical protein